MIIKPEKHEGLNLDVDLDVKGHGCWDDCSVYYENASNEYECGWTTTSHNSIFR